MQRAILEKVAAHLANVAAHARVKRAYDRYLEKNAEPGIVDTAVTAFKDNPAAVGAGAGALLGGVLGGGSTAAANLFRKKEDRKSVFNNALLGIGGGGALGLAGGLGYSALRAPDPAKEDVPRSTADSAKAHKDIVTSDRTYLPPDENNVSNYTSASTTAATKTREELDTARKSPDPAVQATVPKLEQEAVLAEQNSGNIKNMGTTQDQVAATMPVGSDGKPLPLPTMHEDMATGLKELGGPADIDANAFKTIQAGLQSAGVVMGAKSTDRTVNLRELEKVINTEPTGKVATKINELVGTYGSPTEQAARRTNVMNRVVDGLSAFRGISTDFSPSNVTLPNDLNARTKNPFTWRNEKMPSVVGEGQTAAQEAFKTEAANIEAAQKAFKPQIDTFESLAEKLQKHTGGGKAGLGRLSAAEEALLRQTGASGPKSARQHLDELTNLRNAEVAAQVANNKAMTRSQLEAAQAAQTKAQAEAVAKGSFNPKELRDQVKMEVNNPKGPVKGLLPWHHNLAPRTRMAALLGVGPYLAEKGYENLVQPLLYGDSKNPAEQPGTFLEQTRESTALNEIARKLIAERLAKFDKQSK
jgi:hypothetical protein